MGSPSEGVGTGDDSGMTDDPPLYVPCPRCKGERTVFAYTDHGGDYRPSCGEYFTCPLCSGTGEADRASADEWRAERANDDA